MPPRMQMLSAPLLHQTFAHQSAIAATGPRQFCGVSILVSTPTMNDRGRILTTIIYSYHKLPSDDSLNQVARREARAACQCESISKYAKTLPTPMDAIYNSAVQMVFIVGCPRNNWCGQRQVQAQTHVEAASLTCIYAVWNSASTNKHKNSSSSFIDSR